MPIPVPPAEPGPPGYSVRRLRPEDAPGVTECVRRIYGAGYIHSDLYDPDRIVRLNETEELVSVVALDAGGQVVGHYALERPDLGPLAEEGEALVLPEHRHHRLMEEMHELLEEEALRLGLTGVFGQAVTNHVFTQKVHERFGLAPCGLSLGALPRSFHNMPEPLPQRMSVLLGFKYVRPPSGVVAHVPPHHRAICERLYRQLGAPVGGSRKPGRAKAEGPGEVAVTFTPELQAALIRVRRVGEDTAAEVRRARRGLCEGSGAEAVFVELPLAQAETPGLCQSLEQDGFFFSGIGPHFAADGDALLLQFLNAELDVSLLRIDSPPAQDLVAYVAQERQRAASARPS